MKKDIKMFWRILHKSKETGVIDMEGEFFGNWYEAQNKIIELNIKFPNHKNILKAGFNPI